MNEVITTPNDTAKLMSKFGISPLIDIGEVANGIIRGIKPNVKKEVWVGPFHVTINVH